MTIPSSRIRRSDLFWLMLVATGILLQFWWLPGTVQPPDDSYSNSIDGKLAFFRVVEQVFPHVDRQRDKLIPDETSVLVMIAPERYPNEQEQQCVIGFRSRCKYLNY